MSRWRAKPVEIEAFRLFSTTLMGNLPEWFVAEIDAGRVQKPFQPGAGTRVLSANGWVDVDTYHGDWIIREPGGIGCYPCRPEVFAAKYEAIP